MASLRSGGCGALTARSAAWQVAEPLCGTLGPEAHDWKTRKSSGSTSQSLSKSAATFVTVNVAALLVSTSQPLLTMQS